ncbi:MAG: YtpR family tRNA-binding protein, partial [Patescibacteria group bacterium]
MRYSINWLKELSETKWTTAELVDNLTMRAFEVEKEEFDIPESVIVGKILEIKKHPNADRLQLVKVDLGERVQEIVCGATNIQVGQLVPVALLGTILPNGIEIKEAEIRGVKSSGMLCALDELGLGKDHSGIIILDEKAQVGQKFQEYLEKNE